MGLCSQTQKGWTSEIPANVEFDDDMYNVRPPFTIAKLVYNCNNYGLWYL